VMRLRAEPVRKKLTIKNTDVLAILCQQTG
jgi:hypothetical protein